MGFIVKIVKKVAKVVTGVVGKVLGGIFGFLVGKKKSDKPTKTANTLTKSLDPEASRKIILGKTAAPLDTRYWEVWGSKGEKFDEVIAIASHKINSFKELWIEKDLAINSSGVVQTKFSGVLSRVTRDGSPGQTAITPVGGGGQWTATAKRL